MATTKEKITEKITEKPIEKPVEEVVVKQAPAPAPAQAESIYTVDDLVRNYRAFGTYREIVAVALRIAGIKTATFAEAQKIVDNFKNKEVK